MKFDCGSERESSWVSVPWSFVPRGSENGQRTKDEGRRTSEGFTLLELMIVITLVLILAAMAMPTYHVAIVRARESVLREDLYTMRKLVDQYTINSCEWPNGPHTLFAVAESASDFSGPLNAPAVYEGHAVSSLQSRARPRKGQPRQPARPQDLIPLGTGVA